MTLSMRLRAARIVRAMAAGAIAAVFCTPVWAVNDPIVQWTIETNTPADLMNSAAGPTVASEGGPGTGTLQGVHVDALSDWTTPAGNGSANSYSVNTWTLGDYFQFQTSTTGLSNIGLQFDAVSSTTGPRDFTLQYSTNGTTFTDFASYVNQPNNAPPWSSVGAVQPIGLDTQVFDLRSVTALNNAANIYFRLTQATNVSANGITTVPANGTSRVDNITIYHSFDPTMSPIQQPFPTPVLPQAGDVVMGSNADRAKTTLPLIRGPANMTGSPPTPISMWQSNPFIQSVDFDNTGGTSHNVNGNLLGVNFGGANTGNSGQIYSFATQGSTPAPAGQLIGNTLAAPDNVGQTGSLTLSRLAGLSVSPSNNKIAVTGFESGKVIVYDYTPGNTMGSGASLSGGRETAATDLTTAVTQGTTWLDNNTVLAFKSTGELLKVDATTMAVTPSGAPTLGPPAVEASSFTSLYYNPDVSDYIWAMSSAFNVTGETDVFALNATTFAIEDQAAYVTASQAREIALDADGNLFFSANGARVLVIQGADAAVATDGLAALTPTEWYQQPLFVSGATFHGLDVGLAAAGQLGDYNNDGKVDAADYVMWRNNVGQPAGTLPNDNTGVAIGDPQYNLWKSNFGNPPGSGAAIGAAAVPEPMGFVLLAIGVLGLWHVRRRA